MSNDMRTIPCAGWAEKLAALHPYDLTSAEQDALKAHLASCSSCAQVYRDYKHLASLVRDLAISEVPPELLPGLPELPNEQEETRVRPILVSQPGITSSLPPGIPGRRSYRTFRVAIAMIAAVLVVGVLLGNFALRGQNTGSGGSSQVGPVFYITPQDGPSSSTPQESSGGPKIMSNPMPPFFIDGNVYRDSHVYRGDTGVPVRQYLKDLGDVQIYQPRLVDGILYMAVRTAASQGAGKMVMYALGASGGTVLWKWDTCGESDNMSPPTIINRTVYFTCEAAPALYRLYALQARTGTLLWVDTLSGEVSLDLPGDQHAVYVWLGNQLLAESADAGKLLWKRSLGDSGDYINQTELDNGILYITKQKTFYALQARDGVPLWEYQFVGDYSYLQTVVAENLVYLFANRQSAPTSIYALDGSTGVLRWRKQLDSGVYGLPLVDHGNLYLVEDVFATPQQLYPSPFQRRLLAMQGSNGRTLWQQDIPWNKGKLNYAMIAPPQVSAGGGRIYLVDWQPSADIQDLKATMGAFSESNGALLWTRDLSQIW
jgi:outer membrane protein assembly factor BamB